MPGKMDSTRWSQSWSSGLNNAGDRIRSGVSAVETAPGEKAAQNAEGYLAGVQRSVNKWKTRVAKVSLSDWKRSMIDKGIPAISMGVEKGLPKVTAWAQFAGPQIETARQSLPKRGATIDQNIQRTLAMARAMRSIGDKFSS